MNKTCEFCGKSFSTKDARQRNCNAACAQRGQAVKRNAVLAQAVAISAATPVDPAALVNLPTAAPVRVVEQVSTLKLPPPEELPAPYAKRVHDMWAALVGNNKDTPTRIA